MHNTICVTVEEKKKTGIKPFQYTHTATDTQRVTTGKVFCLMATEDTAILYYASVLAIDGIIYH